MSTEPQIRVPQRLVTMNDVLFGVIDLLCVPYTDIVNNSRHAHVVIAREVVVYMCRKMTGASFPEIARLIRPFAKSPHSGMIGSHVRIMRRIEKKQVVSLPAGVRPAFRNMPMGELVEVIEHEIRRALQGASDANGASKDAAGWRYDAGTVRGVPGRHGGGSEPPRAGGDPQAAVRRVRRTEAAW